MCRMVVARRIRLAVGRKARGGRNATEAQVLADTPTYATTGRYCRLHRCARFGLSYSMPDLSHEWAAEWRPSVVGLSSR